jgi:hypothetical protein
MARVIFKNDLYCGGALHFQSGKEYEILAEIDGKYAVSYMRKNPMECSLIPKDYDGFSIIDN